MVSSITQDPYSIIISLNLASSVNLNIGAPPRPTELLDLRPQVAKRSTGLETDAPTLLRSDWALYRCGTDSARVDLQASCSVSSTSCCADGGTSERDHSAAYATHSSRGFDTCSSIIFSGRVPTQCRRSRRLHSAAPYSGASLALMALLYGPSAADPPPASPPPWLVRSASTAE